MASEASPVPVENPSLAGPTPADIARLHARQSSSEITATDVEEPATAEAVKLRDEVARANLMILRSTVALRHGLDEEERDILLTGTDEATLELQATRLLEMRSERRTLGNRAPREGLAVSRERGPDDEKREFVRGMFGLDPYE